MTMYTAVVFPQAGANGFTYAATANNGITAYGSVPPSTATFVGAIVPSNWNAFSPDAANRTQYLPDTAGTLTYDEVMVSAYGLQGIATKQIQSLQSELNAEMSAGIPVTINGTTYQLPSSNSGAVTNLLAALGAKFAIEDSAPWVAGTVYDANSTCTVAGGVILYTSTGGTSGDTEPTAPTEFSTYITDGSVSWALMGLVLTLTNNSSVWVTPQNLLSAFKQTLLAATNIQAAMLTLIDEINAQVTANTSSSAANILAVTLPSTIVPGTSGAA